MIISNCCPCGECCLNGWDVVILGRVCLPLGNTSFTSISQGPVYSQGLRGQRRGSMRERHAKGHSWTHTAGFLTVPFTQDLLWGGEGGRQISPCFICWVSSCVPRESGAGKSTVQVKLGILGLLSLFPCPGSVVAGESPLRDSICPLEDGKDSTSSLPWSFSWGSNG